MVQTTPITPKTVAGVPGDAIVQFSVFTPNRLGRLHAVLSTLSAKSVHVLAMTILDATETAVFRMVVDDPDRAREVLQSGGFAFTESRLVATEVNSTEELNKLVAALLEAELNINYLYSFIPHPNGKSMLAICVEDNELAAQTLRRHQFPVLQQADVSR
jgi:hypothetical protein